MGHKARKLARWQAVNIASNGEGNRAGRLEDIAPSFDVPAAAWLDRGQAASMKAVAAHVSETTSSRFLPISAHCLHSRDHAVGAELSALSPCFRYGIKCTITVISG